MDRDPDELIDAGEVAALLGLAHRNSVSTYRSRYPDFPRGRPAAGRGRTLLWSRGDVIAWHEEFVARRRAREDANPRLDDLVSATARLMLRTGRQEISIRQIAAEAGVAHSDLYRYATSKERLHRLAVERIEQEFAAALPREFAAINDSAEQTLRKVIEIRPALRLLGLDVMNREAEPTRQLPVHAVVAAVEEQRLREGRESDVDPETVALCIGALIWGVTLFSDRWLGPLGFKEIPVEQIATVLRRIMSV